MRLRQLEKSLMQRLGSLGAEARPVTRLIVEHFTGRNALYVSLHPDEESGQEAETAAFEAAAGVEKGVPVQYLLHEAWFYGRPFYVDGRVLIPRPETEELVHWLLSCHPVAGRLMVADWCTGSGCIAVTLAMERPGWSCSGYDAFEPVLQVARRNAESLGAEVRWLCRDLLADSAAADDSYDIIISNPPYVRESERPLMPVRVTGHEPPAALFVPDGDPLLFYRALAGWGRGALRDGGEIYIEINEALGPETAALLRDSGYRDVEIRRDMQGKERMIKAVFVK